MTFLSFSAIKPLLSVIANRLANVFANIFAIVFAILFVFFGLISCNKERLSPDVPSDEDQLKIEFRLQLPLYRQASSASNSTPDNSIAANAPGHKSQKPNSEAITTYGTPTFRSPNLSSLTQQQESDINDAYVFFVKASDGKVYDVAQAQSIDNDGASGRSFTVSLNLGQTTGEEFDSYILTNIGWFMSDKNKDHFLGKNYAELQEFLKRTIDGQVSAIGQNSIKRHNPIESQSSISSQNSIKKHNPIESKSSISWQNSTDSQSPNNQEINSIVMWGKSPIRISAGSAGRISVAMVRALANVEIGVGVGGLWNGKDANGADIPFKLSHVYIYNAADSYTFMPLEASYDNTLKRVTAHSATGTPLTNPLIYNATDGKYIKHSVYIPESDVRMQPGATIGDGNHLNRCAIVIGGLYSKATTPTYYRIDFNDNGSPKNLVDVLRNHRYMVSIVGVNGAGFATADLAFNSTDAQVSGNIVTQWQVGGESSSGISQDIKVGAEDRGGIIFWTDPNDPLGHYKVAAKVDPQTSPAWSSVAVSQVSMAGKSHTDGRANMAALLAFSAAGASGATGNFAVDFPVANNCHTYRGEEGLDAPGSWYLPAIDELQQLAVASVAIGDQAPWTPLSPSVSDYWSSTQVDGVGTNLHSVWFCRVTDQSKRSYGAKWDAGAGVRCVREVIMPARVGQKRSGGVVFWVDPTDPTIYKVAALTDQVDARTINFASMPLSTVGVPTSQHRHDGQLNQFALLQISTSATPGATGNFETDYPIPSACYNYQGDSGLDPKGTWYLPAIDELAALCNRKDGLNIANPPGWIPLIGNNGYFSSSETPDDPLTIWWIQAATNIIRADGPKSDNGRARCIRGR